MRDAERQARWSARLAAKNEEITRLRRLARSARYAAMECDCPGAMCAARILADCAPAWDAVSADA